MPNSLASSALADMRRRAQERAHRYVQRRLERQRAARRTPAPASAQRELEALKRSHQQLEEKVAALQQQANLSLLDMIERLTQLGGQVRTMAVRSRAAQAAQARATRDVKSLAVRRIKELRTLQAKERVQSVRAAVTSVETAAYGQKGSVLKKNNLLLMGNQLLWTFVEPVLRSTGFVTPATATLIASLAPVGQLLTGAATLGRQQHVRFISGVSSFEPGQQLVVERLRPFVADALWPAFARRTGVPVTVTPLNGGATGFAARVQDGMLIIERTSFLLSGGSGGAARVAWMLDMGANVG